ncbi:MAG: hypothetical protein QOJ12_2870 [Thermoleophilales bacterium]|jgi:hypothetical protein|nr:hypothetical protein [Thermoleophilales bacterium]
MSDPKIEFAVRDAVARSLAVVGLSGMALIHLLDVQSKFQELPYMGVMYVGLIVSSVVLAGLLIRSSDRRVWLAAALLPAVVILGYTLTRTTGLPQDSGDIGNWSEPLGIASLFVEGLVVALSGAVLVSGSVAREPVVRPSRARRAVEASGVEA